MSRCGCSGSSCSCIVRGAGTVNVTGAGTINSPYVIDSRLYLTAGNTGTVAVSIDGAGSIADPYVLNASQQIYLSDLYDVNTAGAQTGYVVARQADGTYSLAPPATAAPGTINKNQTLTGDGSAGSPLGVALAAGGGISSGPTGLSVAGFGGFTTYTPIITTSNGGTISIGAGSTVSGRYMQVGKMVFVHIRVNAGLNWSAGSGFYLHSLPIAARASGANDPQLLQAMVWSGPNIYNELMGTAYIHGGMNVERVRINDQTRTQTIGSGWPAWGTYAHRWIVHGWYEAA